MRVTNGVCWLSTGRYQTQHPRQVLGPAVQGRHGPDSQRLLQRTEQLTLYSNKRARGQQFSTAAQKSESETRKILVMARTMKDFQGSPREDEESPSLRTNICWESLDSSDPALEQEVRLDNLRSLPALLLFACNRNMTTEHVSSSPRAHKPP